MKYSKYRIDAAIPKTMELNGRKYRLTLYFDRVIRFYDMLKDDSSELSYTDKIDVAYDWLVKRPRNVSPIDKLAAVLKIHEEYLKDPRNDKTDNKKRRTAVNFITDSPYIYAAFRQYYGINLFKEHGKLLWWEFMAMFDSLPEDSKIKEIMHIRTRSIPAPNSYNGEERLRIMEQQNYYFLDENWQEVEQEADSMIAGLFDELERTAE